MPSSQRGDTRGEWPDLTPERLLGAVRALVALEGGASRSVPVGAVVRRLLQGCSYPSPAERYAAYQALEQEVRRLAERTAGMRYVETPVP